MNIIQKIILGVMVVVLSRISLQKLDFANFPHTWDWIISRSIPVILVGGYLLFILKSKKEDK